MSFIAMVDIHSRLESADDIVAEMIAAETRPVMKVGANLLVTAIIAVEPETPGSNGGEDKLCVPGCSRKVVEWRGMRFLLLVCFDLRFPVWARNRGDYDAILCVASWPALRRYHWDTLLKARAIENQSYMIGVNRVGSDPSCEYDGGSVILDPWGALLASCPDGSESVCSAEVQLQLVQECRRKFPAQNDADPFELLPR